MTRTHPLDSTVVVDVGGTKTMAALASSLGEVDPVTIRTPPTHDEFLVAAQRLIHLTHESPERIVIATPDPVDDTTAPGGMANLALSAPRLARDLESALGIPVELIGDTEAAAIAEFALGAAAEAGVDDGMYVTVSTGIGTSLVLDGRLRVHPGVGEIGHIPVDAAGDTRCGCGGRGCVETVASGSAVAARAAASLDHTALSDIARSRAITAFDVASAAAAGDVTARRTMDDAVAALAAITAHAIRILAPEAIVLGGGYAIGTSLHVDLERAVSGLLAGSTVPARTRFLAAKFGRSSVLVGAALVAGDPHWREKLVRDLAESPTGRALSDSLRRR